MPSVCFCDSCSTFFTPGTSPVGPTEFAELASGVFESIAATAVPSGTSNFFEIAAISLSQLYLRVSCPSRMSYYRKLWISNARMKKAAYPSA